MDYRGEETVKVCGGSPQALEGKVFLRCAWWCVSRNLCLDHRKVRYGKAHSLERGTGFAATRPRGLVELVHPRCLHDADNVEYLSSSCCGVQDIGGGEDEEEDWVFSIPWLAYLTVPSIPYLTLAVLPKSGQAVWPCMVTRIQAPAARRCLR